MSKNKISEPSKKDEIACLRKEVDDLKKENEKLRKAKEKVEKDFKEYKFRHPANIGQKGGKTYTIKKDNVSIDRKPRGAKKGHKGHYRALPEFVDDHIPVPVTSCPHCGNEKLSDVQETRTRIIEDIVIPEPESYQYFIERRYCKCCKKLVESPVDKALPGARFGIRTMLFITWLNVGTRMTMKAQG